jgi:hypothetical protein
MLPKRPKLLLQNAAARAKRKKEASELQQKMKGKAKKNEGQKDLVESTSAESEDLSTSLESEDIGK